jgi:hypothetical protein
MKKVLVLFFIFLSSNLLAQESGFYKVPKRFYSSIDSLKILQCCDSNYHSISISYDIPLYEFPYEKIDLVDYESQVSQDGYLNCYVDDLVSAYYEINPTIRKQITKSCYKLQTTYKITQDVTADGYFWIEGTLKVTIYFQSDNKYFQYPWWKKILRIKP